MSESKFKPRAIRMSDQLANRVRTCAESDGIGVSEFMRRALVRECELMENRRGASAADGIAVGVEGGLNERS